MDKPEEKPRRGRPPLRGVAADKRLELRVTEEQLAMYRAEAESAGMSVSTWAAAELDAASGRGPARADVRKLKTELARVSAELARLISLVDKI